MPLNKNYKYFVGIDPGVNTGVAVWDKEEKKIISLETVLIHQALDTVRIWGHLSAFVRVEDARLRKWYGEAGRAQLQGVGSVKRDCGIWEAFLTENHIDFEMVAPKTVKTKMKSGYFAKITGWKKRTSVHARDCAMLVYGY
jgi:hypothetical protein